MILQNVEITSALRSQNEPYPWYLHLSNTFFIISPGHKQILKKCWVVSYLVGYIRYNLNPSIIAAKWCWKKKKKTLWTFVNLERLLAEYHVTWLVVYFWCRQVACSARKPRQFNIRINLVLVNNYSSSGRIHYQQKYE